MPHLQYRDAAGKTATLELGETEVLIGHHASCTIVVPRQFVSRRHARVFKRGEDWVLEDAGSSHGTFVNRLRVTEKVLEPGDQIVVGDEVISFVTLAPARARASGRGAPALRTGAVPESPEATATGDVDVGEIVARKSVRSGDLMQTMIGIRNVDVAVLGTTGRRAVAALVETPARDHSERTATDAAPEGRESLVAGHLLALVRIADELRRCTSVEAVARTSVQMAMRATHASRGVLALRDGSKRGFAPLVELADESDDRVPKWPVHVSRTFVDRVINGREAMLATDTGADDRVKGALSIAVLDIKSILCAPLWDGDDIHGYLYLDNMGGRRLFRPSDLDLINAIAHHAASEIARLTLVEKIREEENRRKYLNRFLSADVIRHLDEEAKAGRADPTANAQEAEVTILFSDLQGFTAMAETMPPAEVKKLLDEYLDRMTEILVDRHGGTLDKYIGDAIMAVFGSPYSHGVEADARAAVAAAVEMRDTLENLRRSRPEFARFAMRIGINTGRVIAGTIGSRRRLDFTVIGDAVNVASRLESTSEAGKIQIGERTQAAVAGAFDCEFAGERQVKNRTAPVKSWWVLRTKSRG